MPINNEGFVASLLFDATINSGGTDQKTWTNTTGYKLEVYAINGGVFVFSGANSNANVAAYDQADAGNTATPAIPGRHQFRVRLEGSTTGPWIDNTNGAKYSSLIGSAQKPMYLQTPFTILPGETVKATLFNDSGANVRDQLDLIARRIAV